MNTKTIPQPTPAQRLALAGIVAFGAAPVTFGLFRYASTGWDLRQFWMALVATVFAAGVLAAAIGRRRSRQTALVQSAVIAAAALGLSLGVASECVVFSRLTPGHAA